MTVGCICKSEMKELCHAYPNFENYESSAGKFALGCVHPYVGGSYL